MSDILRTFTYQQHCVVQYSLKYFVSFNNKTWAHPKI